jgi:phenylalanine-4-hydroxylase
VPHTRESQEAVQLKFSCWVQAVKLSLAPMTCVPCVSLQVFWYTVEFGCVREGDVVKAFGAAILSSYGEMEHFAKASTHARRVVRCCCKGYKRGGGSG